MSPLGSQCGHCCLPAPTAQFGWRSAAPHSPTALATSQRAATWLSALETFVAALTHRRIRRGGCHEIIHLSLVATCLTEQDVRTEPLVRNTSAASVSFKLD